MTVADDVPQEPDLLIEDLLGDPRRESNNVLAEWAERTGRTMAEAQAWRDERARKWLEGFDIDLRLTLELDKGPVTDELIDRLRRAGH